MSARSVLLRTLGRTTLLLLWALIGWGALLIASTLANAFGEGPATALVRLLPVHGDSAWGWLGPISVLLALGAGLIGAGLVIREVWEAWGLRGISRNKES